MRWAQVTFGNTVPSVGQPNGYSIQPGDGRHQPLHFVSSAADAQKTYIPLGLPAHSAAGWSALGHLIAASSLHMHCVGRFKTLVS